MPFENFHPTKLLNLEYLSFPFRIRAIKVRVRGLFITYAKRFHEKVPLTDDLLITEENLASTRYTLQRSRDEGWFTTTRNFHPGIKLIFSKLLFNPFPHNRAEKRILMNAVPFTDPVRLWAGQLGVLTIGFSSLPFSTSFSKGRWRCKSGGRSSF